MRDSQFGSLLCMHCCNMLPVKCQFIFFVYCGSVATPTFLFPFFFVCGCELVKLFIQKTAFHHSSFCILQNENKLDLLWFMITPTHARDYSYSYSCLLTPSSQAHTDLCHLNECDWAFSRCRALLSCNTMLVR